jgi:mono/diheme cytochrome c family protein
VNAPLALLIPPPLTIGVVVGVEALIVAILLYLGAGTIRRRWPRRAGLARPVAWLAGIIGVVLVLGAVFADTTPESQLTNPVPDTVTSVTAGQKLYLANCAACHGVDARGGGPQAGTTAVRPPSLLSGHLNQHTDGDIFFWISTGLPGGMPAWAATLSETDRWNLVNYLRSINGGGPAPGSPAPPSSSAAPSPGATSSAGGASPSGTAAATDRVALLFPVGLAGLFGAWFVAGVRRRRGPRPDASPDD